MNTQKVNPGEEMLLKNKIDNQRFCVFSDRINFMSKMASFIILFKK